MLGRVQAEAGIASASHIPFQWAVPGSVPVGDADPGLCLQVDWLQQQEVKRRVKRQVRGEPHALPFNDPVWPNMWYLVGVSLSLLYVGSFISKQMHHQSLLSSASNEIIASNVLGSRILKL